MNRPCWRPEVLIPGLIMVVFLCDVAGRFVRLDPLAFRGDEALMQFHSDFLPGPFEPNRRYRNARIWGDITNRCNLPEYRVFRGQTFTTDDLGFRNPSNQRGEPPEILMIGSSFTVGSGNSDEETLPARLQALSGCRTYNAGIPYLDADSSLPTDSIETLARRCGMQGGLIILECLERRLGSPIAKSPVVKQSRWPRFLEPIRELKRWAISRWWVSPLQVFFERVYQSFQNDIVLPNIHRDLASVRELVDGETMLFSNDLKAPRNLEILRENLENYAKTRDRLRAAGFDFAIVIVPEKPTVYDPLLRDPIGEETTGLIAIAELERLARARAISVVNLTPVLQARARQAIQARETIYWTDDSHWNARGIEAAAETLRDTLGLKDRCARVPTLTGP